MSSGSTLSNDSSKVNKGLAVGLALTMTLLVFLVIICILHLRRKGSPFFFGINRKGSRISLSRGVSGSHDAGIGQAVDINKIESGLDHASEPNATVAVEKLSEREATSAQVLSQEPIKSVSGESTGITTTRAADVPSHQAPTAPSTIVMTLVDIPEFQQSEANNLEDENGGRMLESENRHGTGQYSIHAASGTTDQQPLQQIPPEPSVINSDKTPLVTEVGSKSSRFHRAVSAASKKLGFQSNNSPQFSTQEHNHKHQVQQVESSVSKFLRNSFLFRSNSRARSSSNRGVVTTIRPEHHQQQIRQIQLDQGIDFEAQEHQQINPNNTNALDGKQNKKPSTFGKHSGIGLISNKEAFTNPGPPPLPPSAQLLFDSYMPTGSGKGKPKRGYKQPIHIKPQRQRAPSTPQEQAAKSDAHNPGLYGYM
ncbi:hypothetical protein BGZ46_000143 [Entomortierella lignicola]|nr:hypothetical protein BGZ46_000143 [Entomortierella lignicola]